MSKRLLTIGMSVHEDPAGVWMTIENIRAWYPEIKDRVEFIVVDNSPYTVKGKATREYMESQFTREGPGWRGFYCSAGPKTGTAIRDVIFRYADTEYVLIVDSHVLLVKRSLPTLLNFCESGWVGNDLYHGPLVSERNEVYGTHMVPAWRGEMFGAWSLMRLKHQSQKVTGFDNWGPDEYNSEPFEIPLHGAGLSFCRRDAWSGWPYVFQNFGGEEGVTEASFRLKGRRVYCLPFLAWIHRYGNVLGHTSYTNTREDKIWNNVSGFYLHHLPWEQALRYLLHFMPQEHRDRTEGTVMARLENLQAVLPPKPENWKPFGDFDVRILDGPEAQSDDYSEFEVAQSRWNNDSRGEMQRLAG